MELKLESGSFGTCEAELLWTQVSGRRPSIMSSLPFRIFPELSSTDMVVIIVKGMNLPAPTGKTKTLFLLMIG